MLVLDTDHISVLEQADSVARARLIHRLDQAGATAVVTTIVSYAEQSRGWLPVLSPAGDPLLTKDRDQPQFRIPIPPRPNPRHHLGSLGWGEWRQPSKGRLV